MVCNSPHYTHRRMDNVPVKEHPPSIQVYVIICHMMRIPDLICILFVAEVVWLILGVVWLVNNYESCTSKSAKEAILGIVVCNWCVVVSVVITTWCTFDAAGRSWVKMKRYQRSLRDSNTRFQYRRSGNRNRNWRHRKVLRAYQDSWDHRCRVLFCCIGEKNRNSSSFSDIARLLSEFFRDLDVVPSDVVAGLVLLRRYQKEERKRFVASHKNQILQFLSGVPITPRTQFLQLSTPEGLEKFTKIVHFMKFALAVYGWPMYLITSSPKNAFKLCPLLSCCRWCRSRDSGGCGGDFNPQVIEDNCCGCNAAGLIRMTPSEGVDLLYVTYHVNVGETPFFVALDHNLSCIGIVKLSWKTIASSVRCCGDSIGDLDNEIEAEAWSSSRAKMRDQ
ncbi:Sn1-specific diacylglycerol lipase alpha, partial [Armadillidium nasatum]